jgi:hypothetical protein
LIIPRNRADSPGTPVVMRMRAPASSQKYHNCSSVEIGADDLALRLVQRRNGVSDQLLCRRVDLTHTFVERMAQELEFVWNDRHRMAHHKLTSNGRAEGEIDVVCPSGSERRAQHRQKSSHVALGVSHDPKLCARVMPNTLQLVVVESPVQDLIEILLRGDALFRGQAGDRISKHLFA